MVVALLLATPAAVQWAGHHRYMQLADSSVTILRAARGKETISVPGSAETGGQPEGAAAKNASEFCPPPYRMTDRDGCQPRGQQ